MLHELRIYRCVPNRLPALHQRFENTTLVIWKKHGIRPVGFWTVLIGENTHELYYLLEWDSLADRETRWNAFAADPEWQKARAASEADGPIVATIINTILAPTAYSALK
jgi:hypothetical protein